MRAANQAVARVVGTVAEAATAGRVDLVLLLRRCRHALAVGAPEWERDVETAMEKDAALVVDIDAAIGTIT